MQAAAFGVGFINSLAFGTVSIAPLPGAIPSADGLVQALKAAPADVAFLIPLIAAELAQKPELLEFCSKHLEHIFYCGGHLPKEPGDVIAVKIPIHCQYGATELGFATQIISPDMTNTDWQYVRFHPEMGYEFEEVTPGLFELIVKRNPQDESNQLTFTMGLPLGDESVYRTRDLFEKHPTLPDTWAWRARADDIIVFLTGEKTNPITMEQHIVVKNEGVANAIVVGMQRFQAGLIVEPVASLGKLSPEDASAFIDKIWPSIEEANDFTPAHARVEKRMVMLTDPEKPILRSPKGSTLRQASLAQYTSEMDELYSKLDTELFGIKPARVNTQSAHDVFRFITHAINGINSNILNSQHDNIFSAGMDSLMAMQLVRALRHGLGDPSLDLSVIYNNPSVEKLAEHLNGDKSLEEERIAQFQNSEIYQIGAEYFKVIDKIRPPAPRPETLEFVVLTGSTGSLGTHLLQEFLANSNVGHVYCLNRRADASDVHAAKAKTTGFRLDEHRHRVSFIRSELAQPNLGLDATTYNMLLSTATLIVPNAWPVNFIMPLSAFRPEIDGLVNLFRFANSSEKRPKIFYISSVSSVANYSSSYTPRIVPELVIEGDRAPQDIGYAKSKLLAEILCELAALNLSIPVSFARVGQIAGPTRANNAGVWNTTEWLPSLILTSMSFGALPDDLGSELNTIDWMPVDLLAQALVELSTKPNEGSSAEVFNVVNPRATTWKDILPSLATSIEKHTNKAISVIPLQSWLGMLQKSVDEFTAGNASLAHTHPAIKLHKFYETAMLGAKGPIKWETENAMSTSETLREMPAVCEEWVDKWIQRWAADMTARRRDQVLTTLVSMGGLRR